MGSLRTPALGLVLIFAITGCAATQTTLAQELAWDRWKKCDHFPTITLKEIRTDGQIVVWTYYGADLAAWRECDQAAQKEQASRIGVTSPPLTVTSQPTVAIQTSRPNMAEAGANATPSVASPPLWKRGSEWAYRWESPRGKGTFVWSVEGEEIVDGIPVYSVRGGQRRALYRRVDLAIYIDENEGEVERRWVPPFVLYAWPLEFGKAWEQQVTVERPKDRQTEVVTYTCHVGGGPEIIEVPAGSFYTFHISCRNKSTGNLTQEVWYAPTVGHWVREKTWFTYGRRDRELIQYRH